MGLVLKKWRGGNAPTLLPGGLEVCPRSNSFQTHQEQGGVERDEANLFKDPGEASSCHDWSQCDGGAAVFAFRSRQDASPCKSQPGSNAKKLVYNLTPVS